MGVFGALSRVPVGAGAELLAGYKSDIKIKIKINK